MLLALQGVLKVLFDAPNFLTFAGKGIGSPIAGPKPEFILVCRALGLRTEERKAAAVDGIDQLRRLLSANGAPPICRNHANTFVACHHSVPSASVDKLGKRMRNLPSKRRGRRRSDLTFSPVRTPRELQYYGAVVRHLACFPRKKACHGSDATRRRANIVRERRGAARVGQGPYLVDHLGSI